MSTLAAIPTVIALPLSRLAELARLGAEFYAEGRLPGVFRPEVFVRTWTGLLSSGSGHLLALECNGRLVGALGALLYPDPNDAELVATEMFWFVSKEHRGGGLKLLAMFEDWAKRQGAKRLAMVHLTGLMPEVLERLYKVRGYRHVESHYIREI